MVALPVVFQEDRSGALTDRTTLSILEATHSSLVNVEPVSRNPVPSLAVASSPNRPELLRPDAHPDWMLSEGQSFLLRAPELVLFPGLAIVLMVLHSNLVRGGLLDPGVWQRLR